MGTNLNLEKPYTLYAITSPNSDRIYFGITCVPVAVRLRQHLKENRAPSKISCWVRKHGKTAVIRPIVSGISADEACSLEADLVAAAKSAIPRLCLNTADGGNRGPIGVKRSPETLEKMRAASTGRVHTAEHRAKVSAANRGKVRTEQHRKNYSAAFKEKYKNHKAREKMMLSQKNRRPVFAQCIVTKIIFRFDSVAQCAKQMGFSRFSVFNSAKYGIPVNRLWLVTAEDEFTECALQEIFRDAKQEGYEAQAKLDGTCAEAI